jgi:alpha-mannosidase
LVYSSSEHIVIETVKMAENRKNELILRIYEDSGKPGQAKITLDAEYEKAIECDMLENELNETDLNNLSFKPFEVKTIKIMLK